MSALVGLPPPPCPASLPPLVPPHEHPYRPAEPAPHISGPPHGKRQPPSAAHTAPLLPPSRMPRQEALLPVRPAVFGELAGLPVRRLEAVLLSRAAVTAEVVATDGRVHTGLQLAKRVQHQGTFIRRCFDDPLQQGQRLLSGVSWCVPWSESLSAGCPRTGHWRIDHRG